MTMHKKGLVLPMVGALGLVGLLAAGCGSQQASASAATKPAPHATLNLVVKTGGMLGHPGMPEFQENGKMAKDIVLPAHALVTVTLRSYDDGAAPPTAPYNNVQGTVGGTVRVDGKVVKSIPLKTIAHTFTVSDMHLNVPVAVKTASEPYVTETFQFKTGAPGTYTWQCFAPCGSGTSGWGGPMTEAGYMMGKVTVK